MTPQELPELLPCPWCGERPTIANIQADENQGTKWGGVVCCTPEVRTHFEPVEKWAERAIEAWNNRAALSAHGQPVVDEDAQEAIADILNRMESWSKAYPVEVFHEPTKEERDWLHKTRPGLMDCIAASMGRHMAKRIADDLAKLTAALTGAAT